MDHQQRIAVTREVTLPDPIKLERFRHAPQLGPRILFFSGGTALKGVSQHLTQFTHNSIHLITPFDSGGSSAILREAFQMPAVGDVRNRLMALADQSIQGNPEIYDLFAYRLDKSLSPEKLSAELSALVTGKHKLIRRIPDPMRKIIRNYFRIFADLMPKNFNLQGASLGNLVLTAGFLTSRRHLDPVIYLFSKLVEVRGVVRPVVSSNGHLAVRLASGQTLIGQHNFTGKETAPLQSPVESIWLTASMDHAEPILPPIRTKTKSLISKADLICYPMGSFYSSLLATLLPSGVGETIAKTTKPKVFIPNTGADPELYGHDLNMQVDRLLQYLRKDSPDSITASDVLTFVIIDTRNGVYNGRLDIQKLEQLGIAVIDQPLVSPTSAPYIDESLLNPVLLSLC